MTFISSKNLSYLFSYIHQERELPHMRNAPTTKAKNETRNLVYHILYMQLYNSSPAPRVNKITQDA